MSLWLNEILWNFAITCWPKTPVLTQHCGYWYPGAIARSHQYHSAESKNPSEISGRARQVTVVFCLKKLKKIYQIKMKHWYHAIDAVSVKPAWRSWVNILHQPNKKYNLNQLKRTPLLDYHTRSWLWSLTQSLRWRHNGRDGVSNHQPHDCLLNSLFGRRSKKTSKFRVTGLCVRNSPGTGEFPAQMASNAENVSIWWRHHVELIYCALQMG